MRLGDTPAVSVTSAGVGFHACAAEGLGLSVIPVLLAADAGGGTLIDAPDGAYDGADLDMAFIRPMSGAQL